MSHSLDLPLLAFPGAVTPRLALLLPDLNGGGVQNIVLILARAFRERGYAVDLVVCDARGHLRSRIPTGVDLYPLPSEGRALSRWRLYRQSAPLLVPAQRRLLAMTWEKAANPLNHYSALVEYLRARRPDTLFAASSYPNLLALLAHAQAPAGTRLVVSERTHFSAGKPKKVRRARQIAQLMGALYPRADAITAVSRGVAEDLAAAIGIARTAIATPHNPTLTPDIAERLAAPVSHPWFDQPGPPVLVAIGRIGTQKDYPTLLRAVAEVRRRRPVRLMIIGDASYKKRRSSRLTALEAQAETLGIRTDVAFLGYQPNPLPYLRRAALFVLSSRFEGFPNVLLEALAAGAPVVSTRCPSGPDEILADGRYGALVPVGDWQAMAEAIVATLDHPPAPDEQRQRAAQFSYQSAIDAYQAILFPPTSQEQERAASA